MNELHRRNAPGALRALALGISAGLGRPVAFLRRFWADTSAITSLEVGLIGFPFFALVFGTFTVGLWYFYTASAELGIYHAARALTTGQFQSTAGATTMTSGTFTQDFVCPQMPSFIRCSSTNPVLGVTAVSNFTQLVQETKVPIPNTNPVQYYERLTLLPLTPNFCSPQQGDIVYIQAQYAMPNIFGFFGLFHRTVYVGATVQVEQFPSGTSVETNC